MAIVVSTKKSDGSSCGEVCGITLGGSVLLGILGFALYNFIMTIIAVIGFTNDDVENVCPDSELWWWALFIGIIWPFLLSNNAKQTAEKDEKEMPLCIVIVWVGMLTAFIVWAWDQLWGVPGFANNTCAMDNWATYNSTDGADNDGYKLFTAVEWWMYLYMVIDGILILGICGIGGFLVVGSCLEKKRNGQETRSSTTVYHSNDIV